MQELIDNTGKVFQVEVMSKEVAGKYADELVRIWNQIPTSVHSVEDLLSEERHGRKLLGKWIHSLVVLDDAKVVGFVIGYEREGEGNEQYPANTIYVNSLSVDESYQKRGIGKKLMEIFIDNCQSRGFVELKGEVNFSIQTNSAEWNSHVIGLYEKLGFKKRATKEYEDRVDVVMGK